MKECFCFPKSNSVLYSVHVRSGERGEKNVMLITCVNTILGACMCVCSCPWFDSVA